MVLQDGRGAVLARGFARAEGEWMTSDFVPFSAVLDFKPPSRGNGHLVLYKDNPSENRALDDRLVVPVVFR